MLQGVELLLKLLFDCFKKKKILKQAKRKILQKRLKYLKTHSYPAKKFAYKEYAALNSSFSKIMLHL